MEISKSNPAINGTLRIWKLLTDVRFLFFLLFLIPNLLYADWRHEWVRQEYRSSISSRGLDYCLTNKRTNEIIRLVEKYSKKYNVDEFEILTLITNESGFVNRIGDRHLPATRWCFGYGQMQVKTASDILGYHVQGRELLYDIDLNIRLTVKHYDWLCSIMDKETAIRAYNAGIIGAKRGKSFDYLLKFKVTMRRLERFYSASLRL